MQQSPADNSAEHDHVHRKPDDDDNEHDNDDCGRRHDDTGKHIDRRHVNELGLSNQHNDAIDRDQHDDRQPVGL